MLDTQSFQFVDNVLVFKVNKSPFFVRFVLFAFAFIMPIPPLIGIVFGAFSGSGNIFGMVLGLAVLSLFSYFLFRMALWNTYGTETLKFSDGQVEYLIDYGWFKGAEMTLMLDANTSYGIRVIGYEDDNMGALIISNGENEIRCATKVSTDELEELIDRLTQ